MIVDIHCHFVPEAYFALVREAAAYRIAIGDSDGENIDIEIDGVPYPFNRTFFDADRQVARMQRLGIDRTVLSLATPLVRYDAPNAVAIRAARVFNDALARLRDERPAHFDGWAFLPMQDPEASAAELHRAVGELGLKGGHIASNVGGRYLHEPEYAPVFEAAVALDVPLFVHPANPPGRERMTEFELAVVGGYLFDTTLNIYSMVFGGLLDRYPALRLCCAHLGGYALMLRARMQREVDTNPALARSVNGSVDDYLKRLYYDTVCFEPELLQYATHMLEPGHLLLGSDGPFELGEPDPVGFINRSLGDGDWARQILHQNAVGLLGLENGE